MWPWLDGDDPTGRHPHQCFPDSKYACFFLSSSSHVFSRCLGFFPSRSAVSARHKQSHFTIAAITWHCSKPGGRHRGAIFSSYCCCDCCKSSHRSQRSPRLASAVVVVCVFNAVDCSCIHTLIFADLSGLDRVLRVNFPFLESTTCFSLH